MAICGHSPHSSPCWFIARSDNQTSCHTSTEHTIFVRALCRGHTQHLKSRVRRCGNAERQVLGLRCSAAAAAASCFLCRSRSFTAVLAAFRLFASRDFPWLADANTTRQVQSSPPPQHNTLKPQVTTAPGHNTGNFICMKTTQQSHARGCSLFS